MCQHPTAAWSNVQARNLNHEYKVTDESVPGLLGSNNQKREGYKEIFQGTEYQSE